MAMERIEGFHVRRRPVRPRLHDARVAEDRPAGARLVEDGHLEIGPEPGHEEHHFRRDEEDHPVAQVDIDDGRVVALLAFLDDIAPPADHHADDAREAGEEDDRIVLREQALLGEALHPRHRADRRDEERHRSEHRPGARVDEVVVVLDVAVG